MKLALQISTRASPHVHASLKIITNPEKWLILQPDAGFEYAYIW